MDNCLVQLKLTSDKIHVEVMFSSSLSVSSFDDNLKKAGVKIKSWRTKHIMNVFYNYSKLF